MKKLSVFVFLVFALLQNITAQDALTTENYTEVSSLKFSPIQFGKSYFELSLELPVNGGKSSIQISPMILLRKQNDFEEFKGIQAELQYRTYLKRLHREIDKTWIFTDIDFFTGAYALGLTYQNDFIMYDYDFENQMEIIIENQEKIKSAEAGILLGVKFAFGQKVLLEFTAGGGVRYSEVESIVELPTYYNNDVFDLGYYGVKPKLNLQLGITL